MKAIHALLAAGIISLFAMGCEKKKESSTIIIPRQTVAKPSDTIAWMQRSDTTITFSWLHNNYRVHVLREAVDSLPLAKDEIGNRYYDNAVHVSITRNDGSTFFERKLTKKSFADLLTDEMKQTGALLGFVFDGVENDVVRFAGSVGSPDQQSDTYVPFLMLVDRDGHVSIKRDTDLDMHNQAADTATVDNDQQYDEQDDGV